jgi:hypothetical protein
MNNIKFKTNQFDPEVGGNMFFETMGPISTLPQPTRPQSEHRDTSQPNNLQRVTFRTVKLCIQYGHVYNDTQISVRSNIR